MIINTQAFASSLKEGGKSKESRIIYDKRDESQSRRPIDVLRANNPILILDEPQKMGGEVTQKAIRNFNPLFALSYSATHKKKNNMVYVLDAVDAYNQRLVKRIEVKGIEVKNLRGTDQYIYLEGIQLSSKHPPKARLEMEIAYQSGTKREVRLLNEGDNLYHISKEMEQYKTGFTIASIDPVAGSVAFLNGQVVTAGEVSGDSSETNLRRIQIRETILSHFQKEAQLFEKGIKTLSLFFIDEVAKYRQYDEDGNEVLGEYGQIFEEEYLRILNENITLFGGGYQDYLRKIGSDIPAIHKGYFSIDKKSGRSVNSQVKRGSEFSDDISAYDLILKNKERLLSFEEPTRFIFSHSALREGWDNPNVFQICTLKHSDSVTGKRQEVGRGLRLCVDRYGTRMDAETCGAEQVHDLNALTVIASESYKDFVTELQADMKEVLYDRPKKASMDYFEGKKIVVQGQPQTITHPQATAIYQYLVKNAYIDENETVTQNYRTAVAQNTLAPMPEILAPITSDVHTLVQSIFDESILSSMFEDGKKTKVQGNPLNENFKKKEFVELWKRINHKYAYTVSFDSAELIANSIESIDKNLYVTKVQYTTSVASQASKLDSDSIGAGKSFENVKTSTNTLEQAKTTGVRYDLLGKIAEGATLTRRSVAEILQGISIEKLALFKLNPEEFIAKVVRLIKEQKADMVVDHISYNELEGAYDSDIFTAEQTTKDLTQAFRAEKHIQDYVFTDGTAVDSVEKRFAQSLDGACEVCVYAKLPRGFHIPTPVGNYSPDWAIAFHDGSVNHIFFIAETKGTMSTLQLRPIERAKISCAKKLFNEISTHDVRYHDVESYDKLLTVLAGMK